MSRNRETFFTNAPSISFKRSGFDLSHNVKTGFNAGLLIPMGEPIEVLPGDTFKIDLSMLVRMNPTVNVPLDDCYLDTYFFFVPNRLVWSHWKEFCGENNSSYWTQPTTYTIPQIKLTKYDSSSHDPENNPLLANTILGNMLSAYDPLSADCNATNYLTIYDSINALPVRGYVKIWNEFFRNENVQAPLYEDMSDTMVQYTAPSSGDTYRSVNTGARYGGVLAPVNRFKDYFSSCLPAPQKGNAVRIPLSSYNGDIIPFVYKNSAGDLETATVGVTSGNVRLLDDYVGGSTISNATVSGLNPALLGTIDELRLAFQVQKFLWRQGVGGTRYIEVLKSQFGVTSPDARLQIPEYLGGKRIMINVNSVVQTSETNTTPQGKVTGYSVTADNSFICSKSFTEHGFIIPLYCVRTKRSYQTGISKQWWRKSYLDYYWPVFANLGEQPVYTKYLSIKSNASGNHDDVFGYQEAWAEYRYMNDMVTGFMSAYYNIGQYWSYFDEYSSKPTLSASWMEEGMSNLNRTLAISGSSTVPQFLADFYIKIKAIRCMPIYSVPGLADHF